MLTVTDLVCGYGPVIALHGVSLALGPRETLALVGPNGAGKSTLVMTLAGLVRPNAGALRLDDVDISAEPARQRVRRGVALVPEGRRVFPDLSVDENLTVGGHHLERARLATSRARVFALFPRLQERRRQLAGSLSGGEQQMLAIGRAIISEPRLLLVDELSLGLMPRVIDECYAALAVLKSQGMSMVVVDQNAERAVAVADRVIVLESGHLAWSGTGDAARADPGVLSAHV